MPIPGQLVEAITHPDGGRVVLIVGAGCSKELPTNLELASEYAEKVHQVLVDDGVLMLGSCANPRDLSNVADTVWTARGRQLELVDRLPRADFLRAEPNEGYLLGAAMLAEQAVIGILTLNFDLAMSRALTQLGVKGVSVIEGPADYVNLGVINLVYLHRNVRADPEDWVLRTAVLVQEWQGGWQEAVAQRFLNTPVRVFAGLGTPAGVLVETTRRVRQMVPSEGALVYQVDVIPREESAFAAALDVSEGAFIQMGWGDFMRAVGQHLARFQAIGLASACEQRLLENQWPAENVGSLRDRIEELGLMALGKLRARWMLEPRPYLPARDADQLQLADLLLAVGFIERHIAAAGRLSDDGVVEFRDGERLLCPVLLVSGRGVKSWLRLDAEIRQQADLWCYRNPRPRHTVVTAVWGPPPAAISTPANLAVEAEPESILLGDAAFDFRMLSVDQIRANAALVAEMVG